MQLVNEDAAELERLPGRSFFLDSISLQGGMAPTDDVQTNSLKALAILGCACIGHTGTMENSREEGFFVVASTVEAVRKFLALQGVLPAPKFVPAASDLNFVKACIDGIKKTYQYDFDQYFYFVLIQHNEGADIDVKTKQLPKHPNIILGRDEESVRRSMEILTPCLERMQPDDHNLVPALAASALYARSKCPFE